MRNSCAWMNRMEGLHTTWKSCIQLFSLSYLLLQKLVQIDSWSQTIHNWTQRLSWILLLTLSRMWIMNSRVMVYNMKDINKNITIWWLGIKLLKETWTQELKCLVEQVIKSGICCHVWWSNWGRLGSVAPYYYSTTCSLNTIVWNVHSNHIWNNQWSYHDKQLNGSCHTWSMKEAY